MPAEVLVMCPGCGHPQRGPLPQCARCGTAMPAVDFLPPLDPLGAPSLAAPPPQSPGQLLSNAAKNAATPTGTPEEAVFWHADLGKGRVLALTRNRLGFREGARARSFEIAKLSAVSLTARPTVIGLFVTAAAIAAWIVVRHPFVRGALLVAGVVGVLAFFFRRSYQLRVRTQDGVDVQLPIGVGTLRAPDAARIGRIWESLRGELDRLGVSVPAARRPDVP